VGSSSSSALSGNLRRSGPPCQASLTPGWGRGRSWYGRCLVGDGLDDLAG
jgi:hypothetical protein